MTLAKYVILAITNVCTIHFLPNKVSFLFFQFFNKESIEVFVSSQFKLLHTLGFVPKNTPNDFTIFPQRIPSKSVVHCLLIPSQMPSYFDLFNLSPETSPNSSTSFNAMRMSFFCKNKVVSSAS